MKSNNSNGTQVTLEKMIEGIQTLFEKELEFTASISTGLVNVNSLIFHGIYLDADKRILLDDIEYLIAPIDVTIQAKDIKRIDYLIDTVHYENEGYLLNMDPLKHHHYTISLSDDTEIVLSTAEILS